TDEYQTAQKELKTLVEGLYDKNNFKLPTDKETLLKLQTFRPLHLALLRILHGDKVQATEVAHLIAEAAIDYQVRDFGIVPATILLAKSHPEDSLLKGLANLLRARMLKDAHLAIANK